MNTSNNLKLNEVKMQTIWLGAQLSQFVLCAVCLVSCDCYVTQQQPSSHNTHSELTKCPVFIGGQWLLCHTTTT